jgi:hypothetical protein
MYWYLKPLIDIVSSKKTILSPEIIRTKSFDYPISPLTFAIII